MCHVHAEIEYLTENGEHVHSDVCPPDCDASAITREDYKDFLHKCLDEWLDKSHGTGGFYIKAEGFKFSME
jgi:hypothetical protein